jgi:hypothetical protein
MQLKLVSSAVVGIPSLHEHLGPMRSEDTPGACENNLSG